MTKLLKNFAANRRGAVVVLFAITLVPLVLMVALAIDFSFFTEARSQIQLAADAAATHAVRAATGTYALETAAKVPTAQAQADGVAAGNIAGAAWFQAQLGQLPTATVPASTPNLPVNPYVNTQATTNPSGYTAAVTYDGIYPPFFNTLFKQSQPWNVAGTSGASAAYSYVEILMLIDTSQSMLIGATPADIQTMNDNTVCMDPTKVADPVAGDNSLFQAGLDGVVNDTPLLGGTASLLPGFGGLSYQYVPAHGVIPSDQTDFTKVNNYYSDAALDKVTNVDGINGICDPEHIMPSFALAKLHNPGGAGVPCAFACHNNGTPASDGYSMDLYGVARRNNVTLRLDKVFQATEQVIQSMISSEQAGQQFSLGVYQFNTDVAPLVANNGTTAGTQGDPGDAAGDSTYEASYDLPGILKQVQANDYSYKPETTFPPVDMVDDGNTDFGTSAMDLYNGKVTNNTPLGAVSSATAGYTKANPQKNIFIVTDGMNDPCGSACGGNRTMGEMTAAAIEKPGGTGICQKYKDLGFNVYVLYIDYVPVPHFTRYVPNYGSPENTNTMMDFPTLSNVSEQEETEGYINTTKVAATPPDVVALQACAGSNTPSSTTYFYEATSASGISSALSAMLASVLQSSIRVTQ